MGTYEDTFENKNTWGISHGFMTGKELPGIFHTNDWSSRNDILGEIDMEKASYLLNLDDMLEEMLS